MPSDKGREVIKGFKQRYREYLDGFDLYCAVDLTAGEFAFSHFFDDEFSSDNDPEGKLWKKFLEQDRWEDLRVAVAEYKKANPLDVVFMSFLNEGRFGTQKKGWELDLVLGDTFKEMVAVCNSNLSVEKLGYTVAGTSEAVGGEDVIRDVITQGTDLMFKLLKKTQEQQKEYERQMADYRAGQEGAAEPETETVVETVEYVVADPFVYYDPWYDPFYLNPIWTVPLWAAVGVAVLL